MIHADIALSSMMCDDSQIIDDCRTHTFFYEPSLSSGQVKCIGGLSCLVKKKALIDFTAMLEDQDFPEFIHKPCLIKRFLLIFILSN